MTGPSPRLGHAKSIRPETKQSGRTGTPQSAAQLGGKIKANQEEAKRLADDMRHVEAVIQMFDPAYNVRGIAAKRRNSRNPWFPKGMAIRAALDVLRMAAEPGTYIPHGNLRAVLGAKA